MKHKFMITYIALAAFLGVNFNAATVYASDGTEVTDTKTICANDTYTYQADNNGMYEAEIVDSDNQQLFKTVNSQNGEIDFAFPVKAGDLTVYIYEYKDQEKALIDTYKFTVSNCGYDEVVENYNALPLQTKIKNTDAGYQFTEPKAEGYKLYINQIEDNDDGTSRRVKFKDGIADVESTSKVIQLTERYVNTDGNQVENFYEVDFNNGMVIRKISDVQLKVIKPMQYIDRNIVIRIGIGFIALVVLCLIKIIFVKRYRARKEYLKKYRMYQEKRIAEEKNKKKRELELKKQKQEALKQKRLESQIGANLSIRK